MFNPNLLKADPGRFPACIASAQLHTRLVLNPQGHGLICPCGRQQDVGVHGLFAFPHHLEKKTSTESWRGPPKPEKTNGGMMIVWLSS